VKDVFLPGEFSFYGKTETGIENYNVKERIDLFELLPKDFSPQSIIEFGCANGSNLHFFSKKFNIKLDKIIGVDNYKIDNFDYGKINFHHKSVEDFLNTNNDRFDLIIASEVFEHIYNPWKVLKNIQKNLSTNGILLISIPNFQNLKYLLNHINGNFFYEKIGLFDHTHIRFFTKNSIISYLNKIGFKIIKYAWRKDFSLKKISEEIRHKLKNEDEINLNLENVSIKISKDNIENYINQQILIAVTNG